MLPVEVRLDPELEDVDAIGLDTDDREEVIPEELLVGLLVDFDQSRTNSFARLPISFLLNGLTLATYGGALTTDGQTYEPATARSSH